MENVITSEPRSRRGYFFHQAAASRSFKLGLGITVVFLIMAVFGSFIAPYDPFDQELLLRAETFSLEHPLGRDELGRDILSRILHGAKYSLGMAFASVFIATIVGSLMGSVSGFFGGRTDMVIMRITDVMLAFPGLLMAIAISAMLGSGYTNLIIAIGIGNIAPTTRLVRSLFLTLKELEFVVASKVIGASNSRLIIQHIMPNCMAPIMVHITYSVAISIIFASGLSFLGLGAQPPIPEWGVMLSRGRDFMRVAPHVVTVPGLIIVLCILGINLLGDGLRDILDPRLIK